MPTRELFRTDRLRVRRMTLADLDAMVDVYGDADAMRWVGDGDPMPREEGEAWIEITLRNYKARGYGMSAVEALDTGEVIGFCGLVHPGQQEVPEIKYALRRAHWGRGLASELCAAMLAWGAREHGMTEIIATIAEPNAASRRVVEKCGMRHEDTRPEDDGVDTLVYVWRG